MFSLSITSTEKELLERVEEYAKSIGCSSSGIVENRVIEVIEKRFIEVVEAEELNREENIPRHKRSTTLHEIYYFMRLGELGYIGETSQGADNRINDHLGKAAMGKWLAEGLEGKDIVAGVIKSVVGYKEAKREETRLIRKLKPRFNKRGGELKYIREIGGLKPFEIDMQDQS